MLRFLSSEWTEGLVREINASDTYRRAGARWEGGVGLVVRGHGEVAPAGVALDLAGGVCRNGESFVGNAPEEMRLVLEGELETWKDLLGGRIEPVSAVLRGKLRLTRGSLSELLPQAEAAKHLLLAARNLETAFTDEEASSAAAQPAAAIASGNGAEPNPERTADSNPVDSTSTTRDDTASGRHFQLTSRRRLDFESPPMRLFEKAKRDGIWNPADIEFTRDREDWQRLGEGERDLLLRLAALFGAGEESVVLDLLPLISTVAAEGRLEEEIYLASFLWEEAKHVEAFGRFFKDVAREPGDLSRYHSESYRTVFYEELPKAMHRLDTDRSFEAQAAASTTYNLIVEGVLAETGYFTYYQILTDHEILPGMQRVVRHLQADESRHLAYGVFLLSRLVAEHGEPAWSAVEAQMNRLLEPALGVIREAFEAYDPEHVPFDLELEPFLAFAQDQFAKRMAHIERARGRSLESVLGSVDVQELG